MKLLVSKTLSNPHGPCIFVFLVVFRGCHFRVFFVVFGPVKTDHFLDSDRLRVQEFVKMAIFTVFDVF